LGGGGKGRRGCLRPGGRSGRNPHLSGYQGRPAIWISRPLRRAPGLSTAWVLMKLPRSQKPVYLGSPRPYVCAVNHNRALPAGAALQPLPPVVRDRRRLESFFLPLVACRLRRLSLPLTPPSSRSRNQSGFSSRLRGLSQRNVAITSVGEFITSRPPKRLNLFRTDD